MHRLITPTQSESSWQALILYLPRNAYRQRDSKRRKAVSTHLLCLWPQTIKTLSSVKRTFLRLTNIDYGLMDACLHLVNSCLQSFVYEREAQKREHSFRINHSQQVGDNEKFSHLRARRHLPFLSFLMTATNFPTTPNAEANGVWEKGNKKDERGSECDGRVS